MTEEKNSNEDMASSQCSPRCGNKIKIAIFVIALLLATAIAAHSIIENNKTSDSPENLNLSVDTVPVCIDNIDVNNNSNKSNPALRGAERSPLCCPR